ncbi:ABC transporter permease [Bradyrhizobium canariense]|uniref:NitT/TauT family transport system permease protein n=1 Tax=Bradyrhizobium canariense TaxID=255045 RepID=A0A1H1WQ03_9BRAD|nr:ABC transporter permease [Bradyrhizobium canariense]SDS99154.1 NitT/TauT family transport system permease protein [Bradyrhizobium canariense]
MSTLARQLVPRPNYERQLQSTAAIGEIKRPLTPFQKIAKFAVVRKTLILVCLALIWQVYAVSIDNELMLPSFTSTLQALWDAVVHGPLLQRALYSFEILVTGYAIGVLLAGVLVSASVSTQLGNDLLSLLTAMFNPLPAIALLPLALLWFGIGPPSIIFVIVHSVLWAVAVNTHSGFRSVSETTRMAGQSFGLKGLGYIFGILVPAAFPSILSGLKIGWAFAWRTLIAAELVFGATSRSGGLGWFIFENRNSLETPAVFAGLLTVILLGLFVEGVVFSTIERRSVRRWGMQR